MSNKCDWCNKGTDELFDFNNFGVISHICKECNDSVQKSECRICHIKISMVTAINGMCNNCFIDNQVDELKEQEEIMLGLGTNEFTDTGVELSERDVENWLTLRTSKNSFGPADLLKYKQLKKLWIIVKLNAVGIYDDEIINSNMQDIEELVDYNIRNLMNKKCRIIICNTKEDRQTIKESNIICNKGKVYIIERLG